MLKMLTAGSADRLGGVADRNGVNFAVFSAHAERIDLCLFDAQGAETRFALPSRTGEIWHGHLQGLTVGQRYGFRADGPWSPAEGHLFNPAKLLIDPYARALDARLIWHPSMTGHRDGPALSGGRRCDIDSAAHVPKALVVADQPAETAPSARVALIYEAHVKGLTKRHPGIPTDIAGSYEALAAPAVIRHLQQLGVSHLELLPIAAFLDDRHVKERGLVNYWGYQPIAMMAPEPRYLGPDGVAGVAATLRQLKAEGIGVILDVVFNHTGEGDAEGPTICHRGFDNKSYYALGSGGINLNPTGTGNSLNLAHPMVLRLVMDALRHWAALGVAGFRFDLATTLLRGPGGFDPGSGFLAAISQDPLLGKLVLIAEPWDIGADGYRLGGFPAPFREWNDRFRDGVRRFWRGDSTQAELARRLAGSAEVFERAGRTAAASVNYLAAHDGFTLQDIVSYGEKHNLANGENNHDGHDDNCSDNMGTEGASDAAGLVVARDRRKRAMLSTLFLAQGTPMLLAGDEFGQSQGGNNNAYAQDNETSWLNWAGADQGLSDFVARLSALRRAHPALRQRGFLHGQCRSDGQRDLVWRLPSGAEPSPQDWEAAGGWPLAFELRVAEAAGGAHDALFAVFNAGGETDIVLPEGCWSRILDSATPAFSGEKVTGQHTIPGQSVQVYIRCDSGRQERQE